MVGELGWGMGIGEDMCKRGIGRDTGIYFTNIGLNPQSRSG
jgi:hypothetical protein